MGNILKFWLLAVTATLTVQVHAQPSTQLPPTLKQLASALSVDEIRSLGEFKGLAELILEAESKPRAGMLVGLYRPLNLDFSELASQPLNDGSQLQRLQLRSPNAVAISLHFSEFNLADGAQLWLYAADGQQVLGPYSQKDANSLGEFWSPQIHGDSIVIELQQALDQTTNLKIAKLNHGTRAWWRADDNQHKAAGACHVNVACPAAASHSTKVRATARIIYTQVLSSFACSGTLMNNTSQNGTPYFLTANHCINTAQEAASAVTYWQYQSASCNSNNPPANDQTVTGAALVATWPTSDFTLLQLNSQPPSSFSPYWSGWDRSGNDLGSGVAVHHPDADVKKISFENDAMGIVNGSSNPGDATNADGQYVHVTRWDVGTTEGGSSGSGIWNPSNRLVGQLSAGSADCDTPNGQDFYGWIGQAWDGGGTANSRLKDWLAPSNNNVQTLDGCDHHNDNCSGGGTTTPPPGSGGGSTSGGGGGGGGNALWLLLMLCVVSLKQRLLKPITGL